MSQINPQTLGLLANPAILPASGPYSTIYAFGDSLSDAGNIATATLGVLPSAPYAGGEFSNGPVWVQDLATDLGLPEPQPSLRGGTDFAYGGAETGQEGLHTQTPADLPSQFVQFAATNPAPQPDALYTLSIGANDVSDAVSAYPTDPAAATADISQAVGNEVGFIAALAADGARNFAILNVPDLGVTPTETAKGPATAGLATSLSALYDADLSAALRSLTTTLPLNIHLVDTFDLLDQAVAAPASFGLTNVTQPVWTGTYDDPASGTLNAAGAAGAGYLFFDGLHPTATGHDLLASAALNSLQSPPV